MTAAAATYRQPFAAPPVTKILLVLLAAAVIYSAHAVIKHGAEATAVRKCLEQNGPAQVWRSRSPYEQDRFWLLCILPDGKWGAQLRQLTRDGRWREITSFVPKDGSWRRVFEYLRAIAHEYKGPLPL